jgi:hypothetical protein
MSEVGWDHTKLMREVVGSVLGQEKEPPIKKANFPLERHKGGHNSLGERSTRSKINPNERMGEVERVGSPLGVM